ncbi:MAG: hypothetical protein J3K34DRAFT_455740 [Monoraphidium minutum]|nr:MAG: hypothetical protein J3K34DRAFT_455740 [Monoraphidium minutum]
MATIVQTNGPAGIAGLACKGLEAAAPASSASCASAATGAQAPAGAASPVAGGAAAAAAAAATSDRLYAREWLYRLVMFPSYFTPCHGCCMGNRTPKREQLLTHFDTQCPLRVYCSHCPEYKHRLPWLLQVRRSAFKDVVKATDIVRFGCDTAGVQQYTLNGSKVLYLNREAAPDRKAAPTAAAPATCAVDGRAMMDKGSVYCSLKCKMHGEDPDFTEWLDAQDPSVKAAAYAAATAPPRPTAACKRASPNGCPYAYGVSASAMSSGAPSPASSGGSAGGAAGADDSAGGSSARSRKAPRTAATEPAGPGGGGAAAAAGGAAPKPRAPAAPKAPRVRVPAPARPADRAAASAAHQSAFLSAAMDGPVLGAPPAALAGGEWMADGPLADLDHALSCSTEWGSAAAWGAPPSPGGGLAVGDWPGAPSTEVGDWWAPAEPAGAPPAAGAAAAAPPAAAAVAPPPALAPLQLDHVDGDDHGLLVEWPAGGAPLGSSCSELLQYGSAASPGSDAGIEGVFCWN